MVEGRQQRNGLPYEVESFSYKKFMTVFVSQASTRETETSTNRLCVCVRMHVHTCVHPCTFMCTHTHIHTHTSNLLVAGPIPLINK